jgi:hypothetical protein
MPICTIGIDGEIIRHTAGHIWTATQLQFTAQKYASPTVPLSITKLTTQNLCDSHLFEAESGYKRDIVLFRCKHAEVFSNLAAKFSLDDLKVTFSIITVYHK